MKRFDGKVVVITGGGSGMGKISCTLFAQEGASVCVVDINEKQQRQLRTKLLPQAERQKPMQLTLPMRQLWRPCLMMLLPHSDDSMCILQLQASARSVLQ